MKKLLHLFNTLLTVFALLVSCFSPQMIKLQRQTRGAFQACEYTDAQTGRSVCYHWFAPKHAEREQSCPLLVFLDDPVPGKGCARRFWPQPLGKTVWATEEEQAKRPCFILAPQFTRGDLDAEGLLCPEALRLTARLIAEMRSSFCIDADRVYGAGQGAGAAAIASLAADDPDLFAALMLVGRQQCVARENALRFQKFFDLAAEGDARAVARQQKTKRLLTETGIPYGEAAAVDAKAGTDTMRRTVEEIAAADGDQNFLVFAKGSVLPAHTSFDADEHALSFNAGFAVEAVRAWLFAQTRIRYHCREAGSERWEPAVSAIERRYGEAAPQGGIVFYGSSSIRKWTTMQTDLAPLEVYNHGFGGSTLDDALVYANRLVFPFAPRAVVIYSGTNDIGNENAAERKTARQAFYATVELFSSIRRNVPGASIYYIAISPNEYRWQYWNEMRACNRLVKAYCESCDGLTFLDTDTVLLDENGSFQRELYQADGLHFNEMGYEAWTSVIRPVLMRDLGT